MQQKPSCGGGGEKVAKSIKWEELLLKTTSNAIFNMKKFDLDES